MSKKTPSRAGGERCAGCGQVAARHPMAGVGRGPDGEMAEVPVCDACWRDPAHRTTPLKVHYFDRASAPQAVRDAANNILVTTPTSIH